MKKNRPAYKICPRTERLQLIYHIENALSSLDDLCPDMIDIEWTRLEVKKLERRILKNYKCTDDGEHND